MNKDLGDPEPTWYMNVPKKSEGYPNTILPDKLYYTGYYMWCLPKLVHELWQAVTFEIFILIGWKTKCR